MTFACCCAMHTHDDACPWLARQIVGKQALEKGKEKAKEAKEKAKKVRHALDGRAGRAW